MSFQGCGENKEKKCRALRRYSAAAFFAVDAVVVVPCFPVDVVVVVVVPSDAASPSSHLFWPRRIIIQLHS